MLQSPRTGSELVRLTEVTMRAIQLARNPDISGEQAASELAAVAHYQSTILRLAIARLMATGIDRAAVHNHAAALLCDALSRCAQTVPAPPMPEPLTYR